MNFKIMAGITHHPKMISFEKVKGPKWCWSFIRLWDSASLHYQDGVFRKLTDDDVADIAGWRTHKKEYIEVMIELGWLDRTPNQELYLCDWYLFREEESDREHDENTPRTEEVQTGSRPKTAENTPRTEEVQTGSSQTQRAISQTQPPTQPKTAENTPRTEEVQTGSRPKTAENRSVPARLAPEKSLYSLSIDSNNIYPKKVPTPNDVLAATRGTFDEKIKTKDDRELFLGTLVETLKSYKLGPESWSKTFSEEIRTKVMPRTRPTSIATDRWQSWYETVNDEIEIARGRFLGVEVKPPVLSGPLTAEDMGNIRAQQVIDAEVARLRACGKIK